MHITKVTGILRNIGKDFLIIYISEDTNDIFIFKKIKIIFNFNKRAKLLFICIIQVAIV